MGRIPTLVVLFVFIFVLSISLFPDFFSKETCTYEEAAKQYAGGKFVAVDGKKVHYLEKGSGAPLVLIHGYLAHSAMWPRNLDALAGKFKVYAVDLWGFGYSERFPNPEYSFPFYGRQVKGFMEALGIPKATLIGHSLGGGIAVYLAAHYPEIADRLILVAPAAIPYPDSTAVQIYKLPGVGEFLNSLPGDFLSAAILKNLWFFDPKKVNDAFAAEALRPLCIKGSQESMLYVLRKVLRDPLVTREAQELAKRNIPILIVHGRQDQVIPPNRSQALHKLWGGSRLVLFDRTGHSPSAEHPEYFNRLVLDFLRGNP